MHCQKDIAEQIKVLVGCEYSGTVRDAFLRRGFDAWSCDLLPTETNHNRHIRGDVRDVMNDGWDLMVVAHPPCTRLCNSGVCWLTRPPKGKTKEQIWAELDEAAALFSDLWNSNAKHVALENPVMHGYARERIRGYVPPAQTVQPWWFGEPLQKKVCLWLRNLPELVPTDVVELPAPKYCIRKTGPRAGRRYNYYFHQGKNGHERSRFFPGIADAMAQQWGDILIKEKIEMMKAA